MKTAISVPDTTFDRATQRARDLGMSRSEFFSRAAQRYLDDLDRDSVTQHINAALNSIGAQDESATDAVMVGHQVLGASNDDEW